MLVENTLFGERDKIKIAIERLQIHEPAEPFYLGFSGGKDSQTILRLAELAGVAFEAWYHPTTVDPPELVRFIKRHYPQVGFTRPERSMWEAICLHKWPPTRQIRYCCEEFKEGHGSGRVVVTGIRWAESTSRRRRRMVEACDRDKHTTFVHPIIDWSEADVWEFIRQERLAYCSLYDEGFKRIGCVLCPMSRDTQRDIARWPDVAAMFEKTFDRVIDIRRQEGRRCSFTTGKEMFAWWIRRDMRGSNPDQLMLFE